LRHVRRVAAVCAACVRLSFGAHQSARCMLPVCVPWGLAVWLCVRTVFIVKDMALDCVSLRVAFHTEFDLFAKLREGAAGTLLELLLGPAITTAT
jgi:hypothetical protein